MDEVEIWGSSVSMKFRIFLGPLFERTCLAKVPFPIRSVNHMKTSDLIEHSNNVLWNTAPRQKNKSWKCPISTGNLSIVHPPPHIHMSIWPPHTIVQTPLRSLSKVRFERGSYNASSCMLSMNSSDCDTTSIWSLQQTAWKYEAWRPWTWLLFRSVEAEQQSNLN